MPDTEVIAYHGWGFDASCWRPWQELVSDQVRWMNYDRGYSGNSTRPGFTNTNARKIIITHSYGLHLCSDELFKQADLVIIFAGFLSFHLQGPPLSRRSKRIVDAMIRQFETSPREVLQVFYSKVFSPERNFKNPPDELNASLLLEDLEKLNHDERTLPELKKSAKVCIFHGNEDAIVPVEKGRNLKEFFGPCARYMEIKGTGHALPFTHTPECRDTLKDEI